MDFKPISDCAKLIPTLKISISNKKYGQYTTLADCDFYSYSASKVRLNKKNTTFAEVVGCDVITPNGTFPIDATYKNLKK